VGYAVTAQLNLSDQRLIELTATDAAPEDIDTTLLAQLLDETESIINSKLAGTLDVPFADGDVPPVIVTITGWIWAYRVYRHREVMEIPQSIKDDYKLAMEMLDAIVTGGLDAGGGEDDGAGLVTGPVPSVTTSATRGWTRRSEWCPE
jgi:phage gp36-like protein